MNKLIKISLIGMFSITCWVSGYYGYHWYFATSPQSSLLNPLASFDTSESSPQAPRPAVVLGFMPYWLFSKAEIEYQGRVTELTYFGLELAGDGTLIQKLNPQEQEPGWTALKSGKFSDFAQKKGFTNPQNRSLLLHLSRDSVIDELLKEPEKNARVVVQEVVPLLQEYQFSDLNIDIESFTQKTVQEQQSFTLFLKTLKSELATKGSWTITLEITPASFFSDHLIDPEAIASIPDRFVLMAYDFHYRDSFISGPVAPTGGAVDVREFDVRMSVAKAVGIIDPDKLLLGIPLYGYEWETVASEPGSPVIPGSGKTASTRRVAELLLDCPGCTSGYDAVAEQPYLIIPEEEYGYFRQMYYENQQSLRAKKELVQEFGLQGVAFWAIGYEDPALLESF